MKKYFYLLIFSISFLIFITQVLGTPPNINEEIIGTVNGENLYLSDLERLLNLHRNKQGKIILDKNEIKALKDNVLNQLIDKALILQEARERNIQIEDDEITNKFDFFIDKYGGIESFKEFLASNNATIDDANEEIKNQILYNHIKEELLKEKINLKAYLAKKKLNSVIVIHSNKIFPQETKSEEIITEEQFPSEQKISFGYNSSDSNTVQQDPISLRTKPYPTITKTKIEELKKLEQNTNNIVSTSLLSKFLKFKNNNEEVPLLSIAQQQELDDYLKHRGNVIIENTPEESSKTEITEPQIIEPINSKKEKVKIKKKPLIRLSKGNFKSWSKNIDQKLTIKSTRNIKEKFNKIMFARLGKREQKLETANKNLEQEKEVILPGEPIVVEQKKEEVRTIHELPQQKQNTISTELNMLNIFKKNDSNLENIQVSKDLSNELQELKRKINQRRVISK